MADQINISISELVTASINKLKSKLSLDLVPQVQLEAPKDPAHGDISTNIALRLGKELHRNPLDIAKMIKDELECMIEKGGAPIKGVSVASPGFINFFLKEEAVASVVEKILASEGGFGRTEGGKGIRVLLEFVSANPTGPLSIAHARQAAFGDSLARIMGFAGFHVVKEYYINDEGNQIRLLGASIHARYRELLGEKAELPEEGYKGEYIIDIARAILDKYKDKFRQPSDENIAFFCEYGAGAILDGIKKDLHDFGVEFDNWYSQASLSKGDKVQKALDHLSASGFLYEKDGALWFRSTDFGDDKDRVVRKSDGSFTYITPDIAYHNDKFKRGFQRLINLWGPDHHGYIPRIKAAASAMGHKGDALDILIVQLTTLFRGTQKLRMSTRSGEFVTLRELMDEVGRDAARFFLIARRAQSHLEFDLELAKSQSMENPVYYIQYAHARTASILRQPEAQGIMKDKPDLKLLKEPEELSLMKALNEFPEVAGSASTFLEPHRISEYLKALATSFHSFYSKHRVVGEDRRLTCARLYLTKAVKVVIGTGLTLLGVSSPDVM